MTITNPCQDIRCLCHHAFVLCRCRDHCWPSPEGPLALPSSLPRAWVSDWLLAMFGPGTRRWRPHHYPASTCQHLTQPLPDFNQAAQPTPTSIIRHYGDGGKRVVVLPDLSMAVKIRSLSELRLEEVQTMCAVRQALPK
ncbi:hypothetical protein LIA77_03666 [Sarocladium implicatum]|nr:hypothetical protein LIA77_03666 [Sarocladium implicatum]